MHKKILRIFSLALVLLLLVNVFPASAKGADSAEVQKIYDQIATLYRQTLRATGRYSLQGYCGTMVNWHMYLLGITTSVVGNDGNTEYDYFSVQDYTSGGYRVRTYPATAYTLEEALNAITYNGTRDAYNIVIGFEKTNTAAGQRYGHTCMIHAIIDGVVYFSESYGTSFHGTFYPEGSAITCSIEEFAAYYAPWTVFEGVLYFGLKTYAESCQFYHSYLYATVNQDTGLYSAPCTTETDDRSTPIRPIHAGERITVVGMYRNTEGEYWYQLEDNSYIRADATQVQSMCYDDVTVSSLGAPTVLRYGKPFDVKGRVKSAYNEIISVRAQVFSYGADGKTHVMSATAKVDDYSYSLSGSRVSNQLAFRLLDVGSYRYEMAVVVGNHYYADGHLQTDWKTMKFWISDFQVVESTSGSCSVTFDANGGTTDLNAVDRAIGESLGSLPEATREGYVLSGWYTADGVEVTEDYKITGSTTLYAKWTSATDINGWYMEEGTWYYYVDGVVQTGFIQVDGITYHLTDQGYLDTGLVEVDGKIYYFYANGAMHYGILELDGVTYYMCDKGYAVDWKTYINSMKTNNWIPTLNWA